MTDLDNPFVKGQKVTIKGSQSGTVFTVVRRTCNAAGYAVFLEGVGVAVHVDKLQPYKGNDETKDS